jgi:hypothetical protein
MTQSTDTRKLDSLSDLVKLASKVVDARYSGATPDQILASVPPEHRPTVARYLVQQGETLRSEFRSEEEAEAFWAHVGEDAAIERAGISGFDMARVPDPS